MGKMADTFDVEACEKLVTVAIEGDETAWQKLVELLWPTWIGLVRGSRSMGNMGRSEDHVNNVVARLIEKLSPRGGGALGLYAAWREGNAGKDFGDWLRIVTANTVRDYLRHTLGRSKTRDPDLPSAKRLLNEFSASPAIDEVGGTRPAFTAAQQARQLLDFARMRLAPEQYQSLVAWLQGGEPDDDEDGAEDAKKRVRAAIAVLRRQFAGQD
jgi:hypothetical protein